MAAFQSHMALVFLLAVVLSGVQAQCFQPADRCAGAAASARPVIDERLPFTRDA
jgi:hypothetical protein